MKKTIILIALLLLISLSFFFVFKTNNARNERRANFTQIPVFALPNIHGDTITEQSLRKNVPTLFVFFEPGGCGPCDVVMRGINARKADFSAFQLVFFSPLPSAYIREYLDEIEFEPAENMFFLADERAELFNLMNIRSSPTVFIYNSEGVLTREFRGFVNTEMLLKSTHPNLPEGEAFEKCEKARMNGI